MARKASGRRQQGSPAITRGLTDRVWLEQGEAREVEGVLFDPIGRAVRGPGIRELMTWDGVPPFVNRPRIDAIASFQRTEGPNELVVAYEGRVRHLTARGLTSLDLGSRTSPARASEGERFSTHGGWLYMANGDDPAMKWNGSQVSPVGVSEVPLPPNARALIDDNSGVNYADDFSLDNNASARSFTYRATFVNSTGHEGAPSPPGTGVSIGGGAASTRAVVLIDGLIAPVSDDVVARRIYKRAKDGDYYLWREVSANEDLCYDYEEPFDTASEGTLLNEAQRALPTPRILEFFRGRSYSVTAQDPAIVNYSDSGFPEQQSSAFQFLDVASSDGEPVIDIVAFQDSLLVLKPSSLYFISTSRSAVPILTPVSEQFGCIAPRSTVVAFDRCYFIGVDGIYYFDGSTVRPLSTRLNSWWRNNIESGRLSEAVSWLEEADRRLYFAVSTGPKAYNDTVICYEIESGAFSMLGGHQIHSAARWKNNTILGVEKADGDGELVILGPGYGCDLPHYEQSGEDWVVNGTSPGCTPVGRIRFGPYSADQAWDGEEVIEVTSISVWALSTNTRDLTIRVFADRSPAAVQTVTVPMNKPGKHGVGSDSDLTDLTTLPAYDDSGRNWDAGTWTGVRQILINIALPEPVLCRQFELEFEHSAADSWFAIDAYIAWRAGRSGERLR